MGAAERFVDCADRQPDEQRRRRAEADTLDADCTDAGAQRYREEREKNRVFGEDVNDGPEPSQAARRSTVTLNRDAQP
ncbi:MAG: hypothetical protein ABI862_10835 [Ilumatobacteraceae bacterium]